MRGTFCRKEAGTTVDIDTLMLAIMQRENADTAISTLNHAGFGVTFMSSVGGFLGARNATLLIALRSDDSERVLNILKASCHRRVVPLYRFLEPKETKVGGVTIIAFPVTRYVRIGGDPAFVDSRRKPGALGTLQMIIATIPQKHAGRLVEALTDLSFCVTWIGTSGSIGQHSDATFLLSVGSKHVDLILDQIRQVCEMNLARRSIATVFLLDVARLVHI
jgi:uncharacterized protein YaaQ